VQERGEDGGGGGVGARVREEKSGIEWDERRGVTMGAESC